MSQRGLAVRLKVSQSWIAFVEKGQRRLDVIEFLDVCRALRVPPERILKRLQRT